MLQKSSRSSGFVMGRIDARILGILPASFDRAVLARLHRRQREPGPPVRTGRHVWRDALSVGISTRSDGGSSDRGMATTDDPAPPSRIDAPTMRYATGRSAAVRCFGPEATAPLNPTDGRSIRAAPTMNLLQRESLPPRNVSAWEASRPMAPVLGNSKREQRRCFGSPCRSGDVGVS